MNAKQLLALLVAVLVLIAAGLLLRRQAARRWQPPARVAAGQLLLPDLKVNEVAALAIHDARDRLTLERQDGVWGVREAAGYPADFERLRTFLLELAELKVSQPIEIGETHYDRLNLLAPTGETIASGVAVDFLDQDGRRLHTLILGKQHLKPGEAQPSPFGGGSWPIGRYVRVVDSGLVGLVSNTFNAATTEKSRWLKRDFFKIGKKQILSLEKDGSLAWEVVANEAGKLQLQGDIPADFEVDETAVNALNHALSFPSFTDLADKSLTAAETGFEQPTICRILDTDGIEYELRIGAKTDTGKYYLQVALHDRGPAERAPVDDEDEEAKQIADQQFASQRQRRLDTLAETNARLAGWTYVVEPFTLDSVLKERSNFLKAKPAPEPEAPPAEEPEDATAQEE